MVYTLNSNSGKRPQVLQHTTALMMTANGQINGATSRPPTGIKVIVVGAGKLFLGIDLENMNCLWANSSIGIQDSGV